jgi:hypothetical protein
MPQEPMSGEMPPPQMENTLAPVQGTEMDKLIDQIENVVHKHENDPASLKKALSDLTLTIRGGGNAIKKLSDAQRTQLSKQELILANVLSKWESESADVIGQIEQAVKTEGLGKSEKP